MAGSCRRRLIILTLALFAALPVQASGTEAACAALTTARMRLLAIVDSRRPQELDALKREVYAASAALEGEVGALKGDAAARAIAFQRIWEPFKRPASRRLSPLYRSQYARAQAIAYGIQAGRYRQMREVLGCD